MTAPDPVHELAHDHAALNRQVLALGAELRQLLAHDASASAELVFESLVELRDQLFLHFAREEEGLFPFVNEALPEGMEPVHAMETAHDTICGGLARMVHLADSGAALSAVAPLFERFETGYAEHARRESDLLATLEAKLDGALRQRLAALVAGL